MVKDANVVVVQNALLCLTALARGLRRGLYLHSNSLITDVLLEKLKDKKLSTHLRDALDACLACSFYASHSDGNGKVLSLYYEYFERSVFSLSAYDLFEYLLSLLLRTIRIVSTNLSDEWYTSTILIRIR